MAINSKNQSQDQSITIYSDRQFLYYRVHFGQCTELLGGTVASAPPPFRLGDPALCGSRPLVSSRPILV